MIQGFIHCRYLLCKLPIACLFILILFFPGMGLAQQGNATTGGSGNPATHPTRVLQRNVIPYGLELSELERAYDESLYRVFAPFFSQGSFVADIRLEVETRTSSSPVRTTTSTSPAQAPASDGLPGMPHSQANGQPATKTEEIVVTAGAPNVRLELKRLHITIYADSRYSDFQLAFMEQLAASAVKAEPRRGDVIRIITQTFPDKTEFPAGTLMLSTSGNIVNEQQVLPVETPGKTVKIRFVRPLDFPGILLVTSSALLIFVLIYLIVVLNRKYA